MRVGIIAAFMDYHRKGANHRGILQPQIGPLIAALLPPDADVEVVNDTWEDPDWTRDYDLLFISSMHSDFDRARQISHYWRRRGAKTVYGGILASTYPHICEPFFDAVVVGDPEGSVAKVYDDFCTGRLHKLYVSSAYDAGSVPVPRFDLIARKQILPLSLEVTRGCPFTCEFCSLTGLGTRYHTRPPELVVRDIVEGQRMLRGLVPDYKLRNVFFTDNNIGGNLRYLQKLCSALERLDIQWASAITFNALSDVDVVKMLSRAGCRAVFMGLESFNHEAIADMHKYQNAIDDTRTLLDQCRKHGILVLSGLMINAGTDDAAYMRTIPARLRACGLHVPSFISFESPIPGTPHFHRLASESTPALLPNALLRDFTGYTLVSRPQRESVETMVEIYKWLVEEVNSLPSRLRKLADDLPRFLSRGYWMSALIDIRALEAYVPLPGRSYVAGTDTPPPESTTCPLTDRDFESEQEKRAILEPFIVTDSQGRLLPQWRNSTKVFAAKGVISLEAQRLVAAAI